jgi:hypothetical protein
MVIIMEPKDELTLEEKFKHKLLEVGLLSEITPPLPPDKYPKDRKPISLGNRPGSKLIIEERR